MEEFGKMRADSLMEKRFTKVSESEKIEKIIKIFERGRINVLPVVKEGEFVGEIHKIDLLKLLVDVEKIPEAEIVSLGFGMDFGYFAKKAKDIMHRHEITITPETKLEEAAYIMIKEEVGSLPVLADGKIVGILSEQIILDALVRRGIKRLRG